MGNFALQVVLPLLIVSGSSRTSAFLTHPLPRTPTTGWASSTPSSTISRNEALFSPSAWRNYRQQQHHRRQPCGSSAGNVNLVAVPRSSNHRRLADSRNTRGKAAGAASTIAMMMMTAETSASGEQGEGGGEAGAVVPEYGLPTEPGVELVRLDMTEIPVGAQQSLSCTSGQAECWCADS